MLRKKLLAVFFSVLPLTLVASDLDKEKRWADQVVDSILDGEAVWLEAGNLRFLSIFTPDEAEALTDGIIVVHGAGVHPNWAQVVQPLRVELTTSGWSTLSVQMPILANDAENDAYAPLYPEVIPRLDAAIEYLQRQGIERIFIVAHSAGALMASYYLANSNQRAIKGFVAIGMPGSAKADAMNSQKTLPRHQVPMLDLSGSEDLKQVLQSRDQRKNAALSAGKRGYDQIKVDGANHFFDGQDDILVETVNAWLRTQAR